MSGSNSNDNGGGNRKPVPGQSVKIWNETVASEKAKANKPPKNVTANPIEILAEIIGNALVIARDKKNSNVDRITAFDLARKAMMDQLEIGPGQDLEADNGKPLA